VCSCICPLCKTHLIARMGDVNQHHLAHAGNIIKNNKRQNPLFIFIIEIFFIIYWCFSYAIIHATSAYNIKPLQTFIWTLCQELGYYVDNYNKIEEFREGG
jgi:hypothetical protein